MVHFLLGNESEERRSSEFSSLGKTQRDFESLYKILNKIMEMRMLTNSSRNLNPILANCLMQ